MITRDTPFLHEFEPHSFSIDASDLYDTVPEIRIGWPQSIPTSLGNKRLFARLLTVRDNEQDVSYVLYKQELGCITLRIYND